jgi:hypothetical protein
VTASKTGFHLSVIAGSLTVAPVTGVIRLGVTVKGTFPRPCGGHHRVLRTTTPATQRDNGHNGRDHSYPNISLPTMSV